MCTITLTKFSRLRSAEDALNLTLHLRLSFLTSRIRIRILKTDQGGR